MLINILIGLFVAIVILLSARSILRARKTGSCGCGCENCSGCGYQKRRQGQNKQS